MPSGKPLNPYLIGLLVDYLRKEVRPKDLKVVPDDLFQQPGMKDFLEWSLLRSWMRLRLVHCTLVWPFAQMSPLRNFWRQHRTTHWDREQKNENLRQPPFLLFFIAIAFPA
ncbi:UNVERIFIED_CONTAM: hypothetical protein Sangu_3049200 [Sesamum angustifolium]|uniref:Uncharacterized protein n=1 Tax=Sesamum angustifolium TaxID=2727405 RepID=A0AAW2KFW4_9LAMI